MRALAIAALASLGLAACATSGTGGADDPGPPPAGTTEDGSTDATPPREVDASAADATARPDSSPDAATNDAPSTPPPMKMPAFLVGYNEAWFGSKFGTDLTTDFDPTYVGATFDGIVKAGGHVVRLFLFEALQGITLGAAPPQTQSLSPVFLTNLGAVLAAARARGLWVYLTALEGNEMSKVAATKAFYQNLLSDGAGEGVAFETNVLAPLLAVLDGHHENLFGLDLVNEIDAPTRDGMWSDPVNGPRGFIQRTTAFVKSKSPWIRVTTTVGWDGAQYNISSGSLSGLGLDFYDLHVYSDSGSYAGATDVCSRAASDGVPVYLGEFGQKSHTIDDNLQYAAAATFLSTAKSMCFKGAIAWRYDTAENWWAFVRADGGFRPAVALMQTFGGP